jgi:PIN domain nuclease of toxin-antitoxin system
LWEIAIKTSRNKLELKKTFKEIIQSVLDNDIQIITVQLSNLNVLLTLEYHHGDPFDRLLIAQAIAEDMTVLSADQYFEQYPVRVMW